MIGETQLRESGQTLWARVRDTLFSEIVNSGMEAGDRLPAEGELVIRFGVSRQTVRRAMAELVDLGLVRIEQGRGAFVHGSVLHYRLSSKVTHSENLLRQGKSGESEFIGFTQVEASSEISTALNINVGDTVHAIQTLSWTGGSPIATSWNYMAKARFPDLAVRKTKSASMSAIYAKQGINDYLRLRTIVSARPPSEAETRLLRQPSSRWVLVTRKTDTDLAGNPICYGEACWVADRVQLVVDPSAF